MRKLLAGVAAVGLALVLALSVGCGKKESATTTMSDTTAMMDTGLAAPMDTGMAEAPAGTEGTAYTSTTTKKTTRSGGTSGGTSSGIPASSTTRKTVLVPAGTALKVKMNQELSTKTAHAGDRFSGRLTDALVIDGRTVFPAGSRVEGHVLSAHRAGGDRSQSEMQLSFDRVLVEGLATEINTSGPVIKAGTTTSGDVKRIGGGAAAGAVVGGILGGKSGAVKGAVVGGAAGTAASLLKRGKDVELDAGEVVTVTLDRPVPVGGRVLEAAQR